MRFCWCVFIGVLGLQAAWAEPAAEWRLDETPAAADEWGFRPADKTVSAVNPPGFVWRPQKNAVAYELQVASDSTFAQLAYESGRVELDCHCPPRTLEAGTYAWRLRAIDKAGKLSAWSQARTFTIDADSVAFPLPPLGELKGRIPVGHPRLFLRPEELSRLRELARGPLKSQYAALKKQCDGLLRKPPPTAEPPKYREGIDRKSEEWRITWWGNREYTIRVLDSAATLAFTRLLDGNDEYGKLARRLLLDAAGWDPKGATGYRYNDEAGMPYAYYFSRTYTFLHDYLSEADREQCRKVMRIRGKEMYDHLHPSHIWRPYGSHSNRAWHFLGEVAIAFRGEIPESDEWLDFVMNVFYCAYPVWCDDDGGWHEGLAYWRSYMSLFTWWADIMRVTFQIDAYRKPYFSRIGYYPMYLQPPGTTGNSFGDLCGKLVSSGNVSLTQMFAGQARNPYWQWYVEAHGKPSQQGGYVGFLRSANKNVKAKPPTDLPSSRLFRGIGLAALNSNLMDGKENVALLFKSSPFGTQSHGYDSNNAFLLTVFGTPVFNSSGWRDLYGSAHHQNWMWETKSTNCITVNGTGQIKHSSKSRGCITQFRTTPAMDFVSGEAAEAYGGRLRRFTRNILFVKPELILIVDELESKEPATFEWLLHSPEIMQVQPDQHVRAGVKEAECDVVFLEPANLVISQTDQFDPPPNPRVKLVEHHLTAATASAVDKCRFVTVLRPHRAGEHVPNTQQVSRDNGKLTFLADLAGERKLTATLRAGQFSAQIKDAAGKIQHRLDLAASAED